MLDSIPSLPDHRAARASAIGIALALLCSGCPPSPNMKCPQVMASLCPAEVRGEGFFDFPWPNDVRRKPKFDNVFDTTPAFDANGTLDFAGFPDGGPLYPGTTKTWLKTILDRGATATNAFGNNSAVFFTIAQPTEAGVVALDTATLPTAMNSRNQNSPVMLVNLATRERVPVSARFTVEAPTSALKPANLLTILPYPGFPLAEGARYAAILFGGDAGLKSSNGAPLARSKLLDLLGGTSPIQDPPAGAAWDGYIDELKAQRDAVFSYADGFTSFGRDKVIAFTVFTTQRPAEVTKAMATTIDGLTAANTGNRFGAFTFEPVADNIFTPERTLACAGPSPERAIAVIEGKLNVPRFQDQDASLYAEAGGNITMVNGAVPWKWWEPVSFQLVVPCRTPATSAGWPIQVVVGTSGSSYRNAKDYADVYYGSTSSPLLPHAVLSIAPYLSGNRLPPLNPLLDLVLRLLSRDPTQEPLREPFYGLTYFNFINPVAGRNNQRQQGAEIAYLARVAEIMRVEGAFRTSLGLPQDVRMDTNKISFYGHSQGAVPAPIGLSMTSRYKAGAMLVAPGGGLYHAVVYRNDVAPVMNMLLGLGFVSQSELDEFHPVVHALQSLSEDGDAANYADEMMARSPHVVMTAGVDDGCSVFEGAAHIAAATGMQRARYNDPVQQVLPGEPPPFPNLDLYSLALKKQTDPLNRRWDPIDLNAGLNLPDGINWTSTEVPPGRRTGLFVELPDRHSVTRSNPWLVHGMFLGAYPIVLNVWPEHEFGWDDPNGSCKRAIPALSPLVAGP